LPAQKELLVFTSLDIRLARGVEKYRFLRNAARKMPPVEL